MSAFRVGQRVRIAKTERPENLKLAGRETRISEVRDRHDGRFYGLECSPVEFLPSGETVAWHGSQLEPILPEGAAPSTWAECVWQPEHLRATA